MDRKDRQCPLPNHPWLIHKPPLSYTHTDNLLAVIAFGLIACILYGFGAGLRGDIGILLPALADHTGLAYQDVSFCIAVMNLVFGAAQPAFGVLAARTSNRLVLLMGAGLVAASLAGMAFSHSFMALSPTAGIVNSRFSLTDAATLIGVLFFCHQIGGFLSAWLGGVLLDATGSYIVLWVLDAGLCAMAAVASAGIGQEGRSAPLAGKIASQ